MLMTKHVNEKRKGLESQSLSFIMNLLGRLLSGGDTAVAKFLLQFGTSGSSRKNSSRMPLTRFIAVRNCFAQFQFRLVIGKQLLFTHRSGSDADEIAKQFLG